MAAHALEGSEQIGAAMRVRLAGFVRMLRDNGFKVGLAETTDALALLATGPARRQADLRGAFRALFCGRRSDWLKFDALFDAYWTGKGVKSAVKVSGSHSGNTPKTLRHLSDDAATTEIGPAGDVERRAGEAEEGEEDPAGKREGASRAENLAKTDFRKIADPEAVAQAHALAERLAHAMRVRLTRRDRQRRKGPRLDLRRTLRRSIGHGGTPIELVRKGPREKQLRIVVLLDASGSMNNYTGVFTRFVHGILDSFREAEAFLFHTRLVHVSSALKERDAARALDRMGLMAQGVGGGTKIGEALAEFNRWHAARVIHSRTCVMILSDGYDTGDPERLGAEMAALRRRCKRIVWLNPLIGWQGYEPTAAGMAAALPHVDLFAPAHTLESLAALEPYLAKL
ncbi:vWA domain-containing protein [Polymorphum gilvum]|uniref:Carbon monoxide dehydrogenase, coxE accessory protein n=1 Tax=Polymorphum gilvum (strain LMG 25793 / CGMCC 1.9160 / SL003B-26A1) TaxID=991905 RepID=F2IW49_POLGS|nr:VWA domain-containing protein [Polymorphum gilvum]ADZ71434.1 Carbon monoxide dehydrogenase, coxE accessory protein [Polymorphum gilvum SL003B-26A1]